MTASSGLWFQVFMTWPSVPSDTNTFVSRNLLWFYTPCSLSLLLQLLFSQGWRNNPIIVSSFAKDNAVVLFLGRCVLLIISPWISEVSASLGYFCPVVYDANHKESRRRGQNDSLWSLAVKGSISSTSSIQTRTPDCGYVCVCVFLLVTLTPLTPLQISIILHANWFILSLVCLV